jgi:signal transduction histidine kinase
VVATAIMRSVAESKIRQTERIVEEERVRAGVAEEAVRARDEFLSVASHELRTPVAALQLQLAALRELLAPHVASLEPIIAQTAGGATRTIARLASLVEGVLDVSRISLGRLELQTETFDLAETVREVVARHGDAAGRAGCELRTEAAQAVRGTWDRARIEQVISNLLSNALKFGAGRQVDIILQRVDGEARLSFRDRGEGFDPADAQRILRRFERAVSPRNYGGLGLGLYLTGEIVREHGGRVDVAARPGDGATFTVVLPCECEKER